MSVNLLALSEKYKGGRLTLFTEGYIRKFNEKKILDSIGGCFDSLPTSLHKSIDTFTKQYVEDNWMQPDVVDADLGEVFDDAIESIKCFGEAYQHNFSDDEAFEVFQIMFCRFAHVAHQSKSFRKAIGIKKGFFG